MIEQSGGPSNGRADIDGSVPASGHESPARRIRLVVADDHQIIRDGVAHWLAACDDIEIVGYAADGEQALRAALALLPDILLLDLAMPVMSGVETVRALLATTDVVSVVILSETCDAATVDATVGSGARGYLLKDVQPTVLIDAIRSVASGGMALHPRVANLLFQRGSLDHGAELTAREREVLDLISAGCTNRQIAQTLEISEKTVKSHCTRLFQRIGATDRTQAAIWALRRATETSDLRSGLRHL